MGLKESLGKKYNVELIEVTPTLSYSKEGLVFCMSNKQIPIHLDIIENKLDWIKKAHQNKLKTSNMYGNKDVIDVLSIFDKFKIKDIKIVKHTKRYLIYKIEE